MEETLRWITFGLAVLGAALGVFNTVVAYRRGKPRFSVVVEYHLNSMGQPRAYATLVNMGQVPVTVSEVYLTGSRRKKRKWAVTGYERGPRTFPITLQPFAYETQLMLAEGSIEEAARQGARSVRAVTSQGRLYRGIFKGADIAAREIVVDSDGKRPISPSVKAALDRLDAKE